jgi:hypothetical protein
MLFGVLLCYLGCITTNAIEEKNYTFSDLGLKAITFSGTSQQGTNVTFISPSKDPDSVLYLHLLVISHGIVTAKINGASLYSEDLPKGEFTKKIKIPTGLIREGSNIIGIVCDSEWKQFVGSQYYEITLLEDSAIGFQLGGRTASFIDSSGGNTADLKGQSTGLSLPESIKESPKNADSGDKIINNIKTYISNAYNIINYNFYLEIALLSLSLFAIEIVVQIKKRRNHSPKLPKN